MIMFFEDRVIPKGRIKCPAITMINLIWLASIETIYLPLSSGDR